jgi:hypothetical protein
MGMRRFLWPSLALVAVALFYDTVFSWLATCDQISGFSAADEVYKQNCSLFRGPVVLSTLFIVNKFGGFFEEHGEAVTAAFTIVLAISTIMLWTSTRNVAIAGRNTAKIAERALTELERAFVFPKEINVATRRRPSAMGVSAVMIPGSIHTYVLSLTWENGGNTPARRMLINFNCRSFPGEIPDDFDFPDADPPEHVVLGPKAILQGARMNLSETNIADAATGILRWYIWGWTDYDDVFEGTRRHRTEACYRVNVERDRMSGEILLGFSIYGRFNGADEECLRKPAPYTPPIG